MAKEVPTPTQVDGSECDCQHTTVMLRMHAPGVAPGAVQPLAQGPSRQELAHQPAVLRRLQHRACAQRTVLPGERLDRRASAA